MVTIPVIEASAVARAALTPGTVASFSHGRLCGAVGLEECRLSMVPTVLVCSRFTTPVDEGFMLIGVRTWLKTNGFG
jgi:hypothetical protein